MLVESITRGIIYETSDMKTSSAVTVHRNRNAKDSNRRTLTYPGPGFYFLFCSERARSTQRRCAPAEGRGGVRVLFFDSVSI